MSGDKKLPSERLLARADRVVCSAVDIRSRGHDERRTSQSRCFFIGRDVRPTVVVSSLGSFKSLVATKRAGTDAPGVSRRVSGVDEKR